MIEVQHITKVFGRHKVLDDVSAIFEKGKVNLIIGSSGQGKSVLAKCLVGLHEVTSGKILYDGVDFCLMSEFERRNIRTQIGMMFQGAALFDSMTVEENIMFPLRMYTNQTKKERLKRVDFCLDRVNLSGKNQLFPAECSGGMQKRIAIARAIVMNPKYLFCDEPNSGLDPKTSILIDNLIKEITYEFNTTTIVITHDMNSVIEIGDKINFIYQGKNWWQGSKSEIVTTDNKEIIDFVYASNFMKQIKDKLSD
ncbi:MAG: ABC transporter ATP-binding protein [Crocinitomicaceae bacterium]|jgi:phospholipid/cholesterol/gamma-HCH transport system ATP-binding protein